MAFGGSFVLVAHLIARLTLSELVRPGISSWMKLKRPPGGHSAAGGGLGLGGSTGGLLGGERGPLTGGERGGLTGGEIEGLLGGETGRLTG